MKDAGAWRAAVHGVEKSQTRLTTPQRVNQTETNTACYHLHVQSKKYNKPVNTKTKADSQIQRTTIGYPLGREKRGGDFRKGLLRDHVKSCV